MKGARVAIGGISKGSSTSRGITNSPHQQIARMFFGMKRKIYKRKLCKNALGQVALPHSCNLRFFSLLFLKNFFFSKMFIISFLI